MIVNVDTYMNVLKKYKLTQAQYLYLYFIHFKKYKLIVEYKEMFPANDNTMLGNTQKQDLIDRGFIIELDNSGTAKSQRVGIEFEKLFIDSGFAGKEMWKLYPNTYMKDGKEHPSKEVDRLMFSVRYAIAINYSPDTHKEVMELVKYGIKHNLIDCDILKFTLSTKWEIWRDSKEKVK